MNEENDSFGRFDGNAGTQMPAGGQFQTAAGTPCPACGALVANGAKFCGNCGKPVARFCGNCGSPLQPGMKFCGECGTPAGGTQPPASRLAAPGVDMAPGNVRVSPADGGGTGATEEVPRVEGNSVAARIRDYIQKVDNNTSSVFTGEKLTPEFLQAGGLATAQGETPLLAIKTWRDTTDKMASLVQNAKFGAFGAKAAAFIQKAKMGTMMITDKRMVWVRLFPDSFIPLKGNINGEVALDDIREVRLGRGDIAYGYGYNGHQFIVNGKVIGLLRMGNGITLDEETLDYMSNLFEACFGKGNGGAK